ncbi:MAG: hypothetical protein FVQ80_13965 [Planctomycetes bacterium]|nr:hypothetical protein [Planctomycetota bacterium]
MSRKTDIIIQTRKYLDNSLHIIRNLPEEEKLIGGAELMTRIIEINQEMETAYLELRGILELRIRPE